MSDEKINVQEQQNDEGVHSENPNKSSDLLQQERWNIVNALHTELSVEDIQKSIKIGDEAEKAQGITKSVISMTSSNELYNSTFINLHWWGLRNQLCGAYKADDLLKDNPEAKVVLYDILGGPKFFYRMGYGTNHDIRDLFILKICLEKPNCVLTDLFEINDVKFWQWHNKEFYERLCEYVQSQKYAFIGKIRHDIRYKCAINKNELIKNKELILESYNTYNLHYWPCTFEEFVDIIVDDSWYKEWVDIMEWRKLLWVYCDIDDTLIIRDKDGFVVNEKVLNYLKEQEKQWREIHIWTWWNISDQQEKLNKFWIKYPLISKYEHRWAEAEIVIDDQDYSSFMSDYWIKAKNYINVHDL